MILKERERESGSVCKGGGVKGSKERHVNG